FSPILKEINLNSELANQKMKIVNPVDGLRIKTTIKLSHATDAGLTLNGQDIIRYDINFNTLNGVFYSPQDMTSMELEADIYIDRTSIEVFIENGLYSYSMSCQAKPDNKAGLTFWGNNIEVKKLEVYSVQSIW
ncbi:MAG: 2,6-beta-D-fructofuranosidase, partial [Tannerellaceae bacterium]|nr:2,6-beta-D-fructofuranosidase [Tannerellaceae bacterium]